jgi:hypothetical protein
MSPAADAGNLIWTMLAISGTLVLVLFFAIELSHGHAPRACTWAKLAKRPILSVHSCLRVAAP